MPRIVIHRHITELSLRDIFFCMLKVFDMDLLKHVIGFPCASRMFAFVRRHVSAPLIKLIIKPFAYRSLKFIFLNIFTIRKAQNRVWPLC